MGRNLLECHRRVASNAYRDQTEEVVHRVGRLPSGGMACSRTTIDYFPERSAMPNYHRPTAAVTLVLALASAVPAAEVKLGAPFRDHMVVQRDRPLRVWGEAAPGTGI